MDNTSQINQWLTSLNRHGYGMLIGAAIGLIAGIIAMLVTLGGPIIAFGAVFGVLAGLYVLSNVSAALYGVILVTGLLPFGTLPFKIGVTPTFLDMALGAFVLVYAMQWMTGRRQGFRLTPIHALVCLYVLWLILAFALGLRYAPPTSATIRQFAETLLSISLVFILGDLIREPQTLRRLVIAIMFTIGVQAIIAIVLYILPDQTAEELLVRLARLGYPNGGVIRFIEDNPANAERAIGTWVDPNALGGILAISAALLGPQLFTSKPVIRHRWLTLCALGAIGLALLLTFSRASMLAFAISVFVISLFPGYRKFLPILIFGAVMIVTLPQTRTYVERFAEAFTGSDLATRMRIGEYTDSFELISQNPVVGVGFTGTPEIDLYTNVASMYLIMANQIGLVGVGIFGCLILGVFVYGWRARKQSNVNTQMASLHLGYHAAVIAALINATADLYFFRLDFQGSILFFWLIITLALTSSRLMYEAHESTVAKRT